jgi:CHAD domain-containing protein
VKRARYVAELAPRSAEATEFIVQMKRLQDAIGDWHDWLCLTQTAVARLDHVQHSSLVAALRNITGGKFRRAAAVLQAFAHVEPDAVLSRHPRKLNPAVPPIAESTDSAA